MKPLLVYTLFKDLNIGDFVFLRLHNPNLIPPWMERIEEGEVVKEVETEFFKMTMKVQC
jgi:hypothetical protein